MWLLGHPLVSRNIGYEYPFEMWPYPLIKTGPLSGVSRLPGWETEMTWQLIGTQGNKGYSGGPVAYQGPGSDTWTVCGMIVSTSAEVKNRWAKGLDDMGPVLEDAGFTWAVGIGYILDLIDKYQDLPSEPVTPT